MNHSKFSEKGPEKECGFDWQVAIDKQATVPIRIPVYPVYGFAERTIAASRRIFSFSSPPPALFLTRRLLPWNHFLTLSNSSSKMAAEHSKDYSSLAQPNTPVLQASTGASCIQLNVRLNCQRLTLK